MIRWACLLVCVFGTRVGVAQGVDSLDIMIGQMIMIGLDDFNDIEKASDQVLAVRKGLVGGIILYEKHINPRDPAIKLKEIIDSLQAVSPIPLFFSIDEEGGQVNRLKPKYGFHPTQSAKTLGEWNQLDSTYAIAERTASLLSDLGINMNFAPVVDIAVNPENPVIARLGRSYSANYEKVTRHAYEVVRAHQKKGVIPVIKHFPGHGSSSTDTHLGLTDVSNSWVFDEIKPYFLFIGYQQLDAVMTAHIINERLDKERLPATLSKEIIQHTLRDLMHYQGVVISDDMQMQAISEHYGEEEALVKSINAGVDIMLFANNASLPNRIDVRKLHAIIRSNVIDGHIPKSRIRESFQRIIELKRKFDLI